MSPSEGTQVTNHEDRVAPRTALAKINDIRNSIVGSQTINWSEHIYPLVAALDEAGFEGLPYPEAKANIGTLLERNAALERQLAEAASLDSDELRKAVATITALRHALDQVVGFAVAGPDAMDDFAALRHIEDTARAALLSAGDKAEVEYVSPDPLTGNEPWLAGAEAPPTTKATHGHHPGTFEDCASPNCVALRLAGDKAEAPLQDFDRWTAQAGVDFEVRGEPSLRELPDGEVITDANGDELERGAGDKAEAPLDE